MKIVFAILLLAALLLSSSFLQSSRAASTFCDRKCGERCEVLSPEIKRRNCVRFCKPCCKKCNCVPLQDPKTGNWKVKCPCYRDMKNPNGMPKCV